MMGTAVDVSSSFREAGVTSPNFTEEKSDRSPVHSVVHHTGITHHFTHINLCAKFLQNWDNYSNLLFILLKEISRQDHESKGQTRTFSNYASTVSFLNACLDRQTYYTSQISIIQPPSCFFVLLVLCCSSNRHLQMDDFKCISVLGRGHFGKV